MGGWAADVSLARKRAGRRAGEQAGKGALRWSRHTLRHAQGRQQSPQRHLRNGYGRGVDFEGEVDVLRRLVDRTCADDVDGWESKGARGVSGIAVWNFRVERRGLHSPSSTWPPPPTLSRSIPPLLSSRNALRSEALLAPDPALPNLTWYSCLSLRALLTSVSPLMLSSMMMSAPAWMASAASSYDCTSTSMRCEKPHAERALWTAEVIEPVERGGTRHEQEDIELVPRARLPKHGAPTFDEPLRTC